MNSVLQQCEQCTTIRMYSSNTELSFEWSHLKISLDSSGFRSFLSLVKWTFGSERVNIEYPAKVNIYIKKAFTSESDPRRIKLQQEPQNFFWALFVTGQVTSCQTVTHSQGHV